MTRFSFSIAQFIINLSKLAGGETASIIKEARSENILYMTTSQINDTFLFQSGVKVKVVGEVSKKWKLNFTGTELHWFLIDFLWKWSTMDQNLQMQTLFSLLEFFKRYPGMTYMKADILPFLKMWCFLCYNFLNWSYEDFFEFVIKVMRRKKNRYTFKKIFRINSSWEKFQNFI